MSTFWILFGFGAMAAALLALLAFTLATMQWGSTAAEQGASMPGDECFGEAAPVVVMTRAISIAAAPQFVWPWLAQCGRGAGWYSVDRLDNGNRSSAWHIVSWVPPPHVGDATAIGYLRSVEDGEALTWWAPAVRFLAADACLAVDMHLHSEGEGSRLVIRMSAAASGFMARPALWGFRCIDSVMARRQLLGIRARAEAYGARTSDPGAPETGARDQYQKYEVIYASGEGAGVRSDEQRPYRQAAIEAGLLPGAES